MKTNWSNKSPPKYAIQLFRSHNFIFKCNTCINNNNDNINNYIIFTINK